MTSKMKTYTVLYAEDVPYYASGEIEAPSDKSAIAKARKLNTETFGAYDGDWDNAVCRRIVSIEDAKGNVIAEDFALDKYVLHRASAGERRRLDAAEEMFRALKTCRTVVYRYGTDRQSDLLDAALAKARGQK